jgi:magnesium chelatase family protein
MHVEVPAVPFQELSSRTDGQSSAAMREQVQAAREAQRRRFGPDGLGLNSRMTTRQLRRFCPLDAEGHDLLKSAMEDLGLSARAHDRILRMARTIADLDGSDAVRQGHVAEAINYRTLDRKLWTR